MKLILTIVLILIIAIIGSQFTFNRKRLPVGTRHILLTGTEFIFIGFLLGPAVLNFLDEVTIRSLHPLLSFGLGWIGFLFGLQFDFSKIKKIPSNYFSIALVQALFTLIIVFMTFNFIFSHYLKLSVYESFVFALSLAAIAACTGQTSMAIVHRDFHIPSRKLMNLFRYISSVDALVSISAFGLVLCYSKGNSPNTISIEHIAALKWFTISIFCGLLMGIIFHLLAFMKLNQEELILIIIGTVTFAAGISLYLELSPLFITFLMGLFVANSSHRNIRIFEIVIRAEKSIYILLVILAGAVWKPDSITTVIFIVGFLLIRFAGKFIGGFLAARFFTTEFKVPPYVGIGLLSQGGIAIAILINLQQVYQNFPVNLILTIVIFAAIINELISPSLVLKLVRDK